MSTPETPTASVYPPGAPARLQPYHHAAPHISPGDFHDTHWRYVIMARTRLLRQARGRWAWLTAAAAAAAAGLLVVRRGAPGRSQADSTATGTKSAAEETARGAAAIGTWLRQACTAASSRISALGGAARRELSRNGGAPSEPDTAGTAPPAAGTPAAAPGQHETAPGTGNGSAAQTPAADGLPARDR